MEQPTYTLILPSNNKKITYRPFIEKERKILLMALETKDKNEYLEAIKKIIITCCDSLNPDILPLFDIEYIFLQLRAKSIGEIIKLNFRCDNIINGQHCGKIMHPEIDITNIQVEGMMSNTKITLTPTIGVKMQYPSLNAVNSEYETTSREYFYDVLSKSIEFIWEGNNIYYSKDYPPEDILDFLTKLTPEQFKKLEDFISQIPILRKEFTHNCEKCKFEHHITLEGYQSFFI